MAVYIDKNGNELSQEEVDFMWENDERIPNDIRDIVDMGYFTKDEALERGLGVKRIW